MRGRSGWRTVHLGKKKSKNSNGVEAIDKGLRPAFSVD